MPVTEVVLVFQKSVVRHMQEQKYSYGFQEEDDLGDRVRMRLPDTLAGRAGPLAAHVRQSSHYRATRIITAINTVPGQ